MKQQLHIIRLDMHPPFHHICSDRDFDIWPHFNQNCTTTCSASKFNSKYGHLSFYGDRMSPAVDYWPDLMWSNQFTFVLAISHINVRNMRKVSQPYLQSYKCQGEYICLLCWIRHCNFQIEWWMKLTSRSVLLRHSQNKLNCYDSVCRCNDSSLTDRLSTTCCRDNAAYVRRSSTYRYIIVCTIKLKLHLLDLSWRTTNPPFNWNK